jgi:hypothetical protein
MKPASTPRRRSKRPTMRFKFDGEWWTVKGAAASEQRALRRHGHYKKRTVFLHPAALKGNLLGICAHELAHVTMPCVAEENVRDHERLVSVVVRWAAGLNDGKVTIGQHRADK